MLEKKENYTLLDLVDLDLIQRLQDLFTQITGISGSTIDANGKEIVKPSNLPTYCISMRANDPGILGCSNNMFVLGNKAKEKKKPVIHSCFAGVTCFAIPIFVKGVYFGSLFGGNVLTEEPDEEKFKSILKNIGVDEEQYFQELKEIPIVPLDKLQTEIKLLENIAQAIAEIAEKNINLIEKTTRENLYRNIIDTIRSSLDPDQITSEVVKIIGTTLQTDRCFISEYDYKTGRFLPASDEYRSSESILSYKYKDPSDEVPEFANIISRGEKLLIKNGEIISHNTGYDFELEKEIVKKYNVHSLYAVPLFYQDHLLGCLTVHYVREHELTDEDIELIDVLVDQLAIALHQAKLYKKLSQVSINQNAILNNMPFSAWLKSKDGHFLAVNEAFAKMCGSEVDNIIGKTDHDFFQKQYADSFVSEDQIVMGAKETRPFEELIDTSVGIRWHETFKSPLINKNGEVIGTVGLSRDITEKKNAELELQSKQEMIIKANQRESLVRRILDTLRSFLDLNSIKSKIVTELGKALKPDVCFIVNYNFNTDKFFVDEFSEYKASEESRSFVGFDMEAPWVEKFVQTFKDMYGINFANVDNYIFENNLSGTLEERFLREYNIKSAYVNPILYANKMLGYVVLLYTQDYKDLSTSDINFIKVIATQAGIALHQAQQYEDAKKQLERESLLRNIIDKMRSSLDIDEILSFICYETAKLFNVQRTAIPVLEEMISSSGYIVKKEYVESDKYAFVKDSDIVMNPEVPKFWAQQVIEKKEVFAVDDIANSNVPESFKQAYEILGVKSIIGCGIQKDNHVFGALLLSEYTRVRHWTEEEKLLLKTIADQVYISLNQSELYEKQKKNAQREKLLRDIVIAIRSSLDINEVKKNIVTELCKVFKADRCYFRRYDKYKNMFSPPIVEYLSSDDIDSMMNETPDQEGLAYFFNSINPFRKGFSPIVVRREEVREGTPTQRYFDNAKIKANYTVALTDRDDELYYLVMHYIKESPNLDKEDEEFLATIAAQIVIALEHAKMYKKTKLNAQRSRLIGNILSKVIKSFDMNEMKKIVRDIGIITKADRCYFVEVNLDKMKTNPIGAHGEYLANSQVMSVLGYDFSIPNIKAFLDLFLQNNDLLVFDYEELDKIENENINKYSKFFGLKSGIGIPFFYLGKLIAILVIEYVNQKQLPTEDELEFLRLLGNQVGMVYKQIKLYQDTKNTAELEKFNRNILEILRTTLDRSTIKSLFVQNIGKYFGADRVFFAEFDEKHKIYLPIEKGSEYLSTPNEVSFVGYDWTNSAAKDYIQPLLEKREFKIPCWNDYVKNNMKSEAFMKRFEDSKTKSSYNFPVLYQGRMMGYFSIEFTKEDCKILSDEDIKRIRNICSQAGISLYQAELFEKYQESAQSKEDFIVNISREFKEPLDKIIEYTTELEKEDLDREHQYGYLENIIQNTKRLKELREDIINISEVDSENFELSMQSVDSLSLINEAIEQIRPTAIIKNINIETALANINVKADSKRFYQIVYDLLKTAVNSCSSNSNFLVSSWLENSKLYVSLSILGYGMSLDNQNKVFELFKRIDLSYEGGRTSVDLGLFLVKKLIGMHDGKLYVDSIEDGGTKVWFVLPHASTRY